MKEKSSEETFQLFILKQYICMCYFDSFTHNLTPILVNDLKRLHAWLVLRKYKNSQKLIGNKCL